MKFCSTHMLNSKKSGVLLSHIQGVHSLTALGLVISVTLLVPVWYENIFSVLLHWGLAISNSSLQLHPTSLTYFDNCTCGLCNLQKCSCLVKPVEKVQFNYSTYTTWKLDLLRIWIGSTTASTSWLLLCSAMFWLWFLTRHKSSEIIFH